MARKSGGNDRFTEGLFEKTFRNTIRNNPKFSDLDNISQQREREKAWEGFMRGRHVSWQKNRTPFPNTVEEKRWAGRPLSLLNMDYKEPSFKGYRGARDDLNFTSDVLQGKTTWRNGETEIRGAYRRLATHAVLDTNYGNIESYQRVATNAKGAPVAISQEEFDGILDKQIQKQRETIEGRIGRKFDPTEWEKIAAQMTDKAKGETFRSERKRQMLKRQSRMERAGHGQAIKQVADKFGISYEQAKHMQDVYGMGASGPFKVKALLASNNWVTLADYEAMSPAQQAVHVLTDAGFNEHTALQQKIHRVSEEAKILTAVKSDIAASFGSKDQEIRFKNTVEAMKGGRHNALINEFELGTKTWDKYGAFEFLQTFLSKHTAISQPISSSILSDDKNFVSNLYGYARRAHEAMTMTDMTKDARRVKGSRSMTPFGVLMERLHQLDHYANNANAAGKVLRDEYRTISYSEEARYNAGMTDDTYRSSYDIEKAQVEMGLRNEKNEEQMLWQREHEETLRSQERLERMGKWVEKDGKLVWESPYDMVMDTNGNMRPRALILAPHQATRYAVEGLLGGDLVDEERKNLANWGRAAQENPDGMYVQRGDLAAHSIDSIDHERGVIHTTQLHAIAKDANIKVRLSASDRGATDMVELLRKASYQIDDYGQAEVQKTVSDVVQLNIGEKAKALLSQDIDHAQNIVKAISEDNTLTMNRQGLLERLTTGMHVNPATGKGRLPQWMYESVKDTAGWLLSPHATQDQSLYSLAYQALDNALGMNIDLEKLQGDDNFLRRLGRMGRLPAQVEKSALMQHIQTAISRDFVNQMQVSYFAEAASRGNTDHTLRTLIHDYMINKGKNPYANTISSSDMPSLPEVEQIVRRADKLLQEKGMDHLKGAVKYLRRNWSTLLESSHDLSLDQMMEGRDMADDGMSAQELEIERGARNMRGDGIEKTFRNGSAINGGQHISAGTDEQLGRLMNLYRKQTGASVKETKALFQNEGALGGLLSSLVGQTDDEGKGLLNVTSMQHAQALGEFTKAGFQLPGEMTHNGETIYGHLTTGADGDAFFRGHGGPAIRIVNHADQARSVIGADTAYDPDLAVKATMGDSPVTLPANGDIPIITNHPSNVREGSRLYKGYMPQTMAQSLTYMDNVKNGAPVVVMDLETTFLPNRPEMAHLLEASMRRYKWDATSKEMVEQDAEHILVRPDAFLVRQAAQIHRDVDLAVDNALTKHFGSDDLNALIATHKEAVTKVLGSVDEVSFLRNIAKYSGTEGAGQWGDFGNLPDNFMSRLKSDAAGAMDTLARDGTHDLYGALHSMQSFIGKDIVLAQNGLLAEQKWMDMFHNRVGNGAEGFLDHRHALAQTDMDRAFLEALPDAYGEMHIDNLRAIAGHSPFMAETLEGYHTGMESEFLDPFRPKMLELIHASRNHDGMANGHSMKSQVDRLAERLGPDTVNKYIGGAHAADVDTDVTAKVFGEYMKDFKGYTPQFMKSGDLVVKIRANQGDQVQRGAYVVDGYDYNKRTLNMTDANGRSVSESYASINEMNAVIDDNFIPVKDTAYGQRILDDLHFDNARRDIQESTSYGKFVRNQLKYSGLPIDGAGQITSPSIMALREMGEYNEIANHLNPNIPVTQNNKDSMRYAAEYWNSPEARMKGEALGRVQDMMDAGHLDEAGGRKLMDQYQDAIGEMAAETGHSRGTRNLAGVINGGVMEDGTRMLLPARTQGELVGSLWGQVGSLTKGYKNAKNLSGDALRNDVIRSVLLPHLQEQGLWNGEIRKDGGLAGEERINGIAAQMAHRVGNSEATVDGLSPLITEANEGRAPQILEDVFSQEMAKMKGITLQAYETAQISRRTLEQQIGGLVPSEIRLAKDFSGDTNYDPQKRWNATLEGQTDAELAQMGEVRELHSKAKQVGPEGDSARAALGWTSDDMREHIMPVGQHAGKPMGDLPQDYITHMMNQDQPRWDVHKDIIRDYQDWVTQTPYKNPTTEKDMGLREWVADQWKGSNQVSDTMIIDQQKTMGIDPDRDRMRAEDAIFKQKTTGYPDVAPSAERGQARQLMEDTYQSTKSIFRKVGLKGGLFGAAALAGGIIAGNMLTDPSSWKRPQGDSPDSDGNYDVPHIRPDTGTNHARIEERGTGLDGLRITARGRAAGHMSNAELAAMASDGIRQGVPIETNIKVSSHDDTSSVNQDWLKQTFTEYMNTGYVKNG